MRFLDRAIAICAAFGIIIGIFQYFQLAPMPQLAGAEWRLEDQYFMVRDYIWPSGAWKNSAFDDIVLVSIDKESGRRLAVDESQHWPRKIYAALVAKVRAAGADVVVLDVPLLGKSEYSGDDQYLVEQLRDVKNVILTSGVDSSEVRDSRPASPNTLVMLQSPYTAFVDALGDTGGVGNDSIVADPDGIVRHANLIFDQLSPFLLLYKSLALRVTEKVLGAQSSVNDRDIYLKNRLLPASVRVNFAGPVGSFKVIPLWRALEWEKHAQHGLFSMGSKTEHANSVEDSMAAQNPFKHKVVLIGMFDPSWLGAASQAAYGNSERSFLTPVAPPSTPMSGVEVQANVIATILGAAYISEPELWEEWLILLFVSLLVARLLALFPSRPVLSIFAIAVFSCAWLVMAFVVFVFFRMAIPSVVPIMALAWPASTVVLLIQHFKVKRERRKQTRLFRSLAAKPLAMEIERSLLAELGLAGRRLTVTMVACQLRGFTTANAEKEPEEIIHSLDMCLDQMMQSIAEHGGLVERVWNCGVIGLWGAPIASDSAVQVDQAAACVLDIRARLTDLKQMESPPVLEEELEWQKAPFGLACGINTGEAICGAINAQARDSILTQYGAVGPCVDLAVELESLNSQYGTICMVGAATASVLTDKFEYREVDRRKLANKKQHQSIYELLSRRGQLSGAYEEAMDLFRQGRVAFEEGRFDEAERLFSTTLSMVPDDKPCSIMLERCRQAVHSADKPANESRRT